MGQLGLDTSAFNFSDMNFLVFSACVALSTSAMVTHHNGAVVPADTPAVAAAKQAHHNAGGVVHAVPYSVHVPGSMVALANGAVVPADTPEVHAAKAAHAATGGVVHAHAVLPYAYTHGMVTHFNGAVVPVEPADVVAARAEHLAAHHA